MESASIDPGLISNAPSLLTDTHDVSDFNLFDGVQCSLPNSNLTAK